MKTINIFLASFILMIAAVSCDNQNVHMNTIINYDGTCIREVTYKNTMTKAVRDSVWEKGTGWSMPIPECLALNSMHESHTDIEEDTVTTSFRQQYNSVEEMSANTPLLMNGVPLHSKASLKKHFHFFYTDYEFKETFESMKDKFPVYPSDFQDKDIVSYWFTGAPNIMEGLSGAEVANKIHDIEPFVNKWLNEIAIREIYDAITSHYDSIPNAPLTKEEFIATRDSLSNYIQEYNVDAIDISLNENKVLADFFHTDAYNIFFDENHPYGKELSNRFSDLLEIFSFNIPYSIKMPGKIICGNGLVSNEDESIMLFKLTGERLIPGEYTFTATSRSTNTWAIFLCIIIVTASITTTFLNRWLGRKAKKK